MKVHTNDISGKTIRETNVYTVIDNNHLDHLTLSKTVLHAGKETSGHKHENQEEIYFFISGHGQMELDDEIIDIAPGDIIFIKAGVFHKVYNHFGEDLEFNCVFETYTR